MMTIVQSPKSKVQGLPVMFEARGDSRPTGDGEARGDARPTHFALAGFTLIELLVVIAIIGLLASLVVGGAQIAIVKARRSRVETERNALETAIDSYKKTKGFYPPDNSRNNTNVDTVQNSLYYELTGAAVIGTPPNNTFQAVSGEILKPVDIFTFFNIGDAVNGGGILNSSSDLSAVGNFYKSLKADQHQLVAAKPAGNYNVLGVRVSGPIQLFPPSGTQAGSPMNPWHYVSSNPTNNTETYDLWLDVSWGGKTNRVSNWSKDPQVVF